METTASITTEIWRGGCLDPRLRFLAIRLKLLSAMLSFLCSITSAMF